MAVVNPPAYLHNLGSVNTAEMLRGQASLMSIGRHSSGGLRPLGGVQREMGAGYAVAQNGSPNMSVNVQGGVALVPGTEGLTQGSYIVVNSATENLAIAAAHATLARIDRVGIRVRDQAYSGADNDAANVVVTGTPSGSPVAPAEPNNFLTLALVSVPAADTTITTSQITDMRIGLCAPGGVIWCPSTNRPVAGQILTGQEIYETDTGLYKRFDGATWAQSRPWVTRTQLGSAASEINMTGIPSTFRMLDVRFAARSAAAVVAETMMMKVNNAGANHLYNQTIHQNVSSSPSANNSGASGFPVCLVPGSTATASRFGGGHVRVTNWHAPGGGRPHFVWQSGSYAAAAANAYNEYSQGVYDAAGPYTQLRFISNSAANLEAGSWVRIEGWE
jgi:hypothetical protein